MKSGYPIGGLEAKETKMLELLLIMALIGVIAWALVTYVPMPQPVKVVIIVAATIFCVLLLIRAFGLDLQVPALR